MAIQNLVLSPSLIPAILNDPDNQVWVWLQNYVWMSQMYQLLGTNDPEMFAFFYSDSDNIPDQFEEIYRSGESYEFHLLDGSYLSGKFGKDLESWWFTVGLGDSNHSAPQNIIFTNDPGWISDFGWE